MCSAELQQAARALRKYIARGGEQEKQRAGEAASGRGSTAVGGSACVCFEDVCRHVWPPHFLA